jgi:hypothetical protein
MHRAAFVPKHCTRLHAAAPTCSGVAVKTAVTEHHVEPKTGLEPAANSHCVVVRDGGLDLLRRAA